MASVEGFHRAKVVSTSDPDSKGRVRLKIPSVFGDAITGWVPPFIGSSYPTTGEVVWAVFEAGDPARAMFVARTGGSPNLDGGHPDTNFGGIAPVDGGGV